MESDRGMCNPYAILRSYDEGNRSSTQTFVKNMFSSLEDSDASILDATTSNGKPLLYIAFCRRQFMFIKEVIKFMKHDVVSLREVLLQTWVHKTKWGRLIHVIASESGLDVVLDIVLKAFVGFPEILDELFAEKDWNNASFLQIATQTRSQPEIVVEKVLQKVMKPLSLIKLEGACGDCLAMCALCSKKYGVLGVLKKYDETYVNWCIEIYKERGEWYDIEKGDM